MMIASDKKKILQVDESQDDCDLFKIILALAQEGYIVESTQSFTNALQLIESQSFDLCLFSTALQNGSGFELLERLRAIDASIPVIMCSTDARDSTRRQALQAGARAFFLKPIDYDLLVSTVIQLTA
jgi:DNA-binding NtrC family response regulator